MVSKNKDPHYRSKIAEACIDFGSHLLKSRSSSVTIDDIQTYIKDLFQWLEDKEAFTEKYYGIALHAIEFGKNLLSTRKTITPDESLQAIKELFIDFSSS